MLCNASATACRSSWKLFTFSSNVVTVPSVSVARSSTLGRNTRDTLLVDSTTSTRQLRSGGASAQHDAPLQCADAPQALQVRQLCGRLHLGARRSSVHAPRRALRLHDWTSTRQGRGA